MTVTRLKIFPSNTARAIAFSGQTVDSRPKGKRRQLWLPAGTYRVCGPETLSIKLRGGDLRLFPAIRLVRQLRPGCDIPDEVFYVSPDVVRDPFLPAPAVTVSCNQ